MCSLQEAREKEEEAEALADMQLVQEAETSKMARDISNEVGFFHIHIIQNLKGMYL